MAQTPPDIASPLDPNSPADQTMDVAMSSVIRYRLLYRQRLIDNGATEQMADTLAAQFEYSYWQAFLGNPGPGRMIVR